MQRRNYAMHVWGYSGVCPSLPCERASDFLAAPFAVAVVDSWSTGGRSRSLAPYLKKPFVRWLGWLKSMKGWTDGWLFPTVCPGCKVHSFVQ